MATYKLDQKGQISTPTDTSLGGNYSTHAVAGFHNSIFQNTATDNAKLSADNAANATATGSLPVWAWIAIGVAAAVLLLVMRHHKRK